MSKLIWTPGSPKTDGMYWYDSRLSTLKMIVRRPMLVQVRNGKRHGYGPYGSGPFEGYYYCEKMENICRHALIPNPAKWQPTSTIRERHTYGWFKDANGYLGFAIASPGYHDEVFGDWIYVDHPSCGMMCGYDVRNSEGWVFSPVEVPKV